MKGENVINQKYGRLLIIADGKGLIEGKKKLRSVICKCDCGNTKELKLRYVKRGDIKSCGCLALEQKTVVNEGDTFGLWTVIKEAEGYFDRKGEKADRTFSCKCVCGKEKNVNLQSLLKGSSKSCGCQGIPPKEKIKKEKIIPTNTEEEQWKESITFKGYYVSTLGRLFSYQSQYMFPKKRVYRIKEGEYSIIVEMYKTFIENISSDEYQIYLEGEDIKIDNIYYYKRNCLRKKKLYNVYSNMKVRCNNPNCKSYPQYGGKGITIEESFSTFGKFYRWSVENGYDEEKDLEIDRKDRKGNYSADNCRWVTKEENMLNQVNINLTLEDVAWIRSEDFSLGEALEKFTCSEYVIMNIREYKTFKNL